MIQQAIFPACASLLIVSAASGTVITMPDFEAVSLAPATFFFSEASNGPELDGGAPALYGPVTDWEQTVFNGSTIDWIALEYKIIQDPKEAYDVGEFEALSIDQSTDPTVEGAAAPGTVQPFTVEYAPTGQAVTFVFSELDSHAFLESLTYGFRVLNESGRDIGYGLQITPFPVPTPGAMALLGLASLAAVRRRR